MATPIQLIVGLGNPGSEYTATRHNAGAWFVEELADDAGITLRSDTKFLGISGQINVGSKSCRLLIPTTYMNHSGQAVQALAKFYKLSPQEILVAHDELDLPVGINKLKLGGGHGGHNGLRDIISALGNNQFLRLRIGIGHPGHRDDVLNYVLGKPSRSDKEAIDQANYQIFHLLPHLVKGDLQRAMTQLHSR